MPTLTALENVLLPIELNGHRQPREYATHLLARVGVDHLAGNLPNELSGGEQQRVAIARALANDPPILLADEPTGNLDSAAGQQVLQLLEETWKLGKMLILVTHDQTVAHRASRMIEMRDGNIVGDTRLRDRFAAGEEQPLEHLNGNRDEEWPSPPNPLSQFWERGKNSPSSHPSAKIVREGKKLPSRSPSPRIGRGG